MAKPQKDSNEFTTISVRKIDKQRMRQYAKFIKKTKNGSLYESDAIVFNKMVALYMKDHPEMMGDSVPTYPTKQKSTDILLAKSQQD